MHKQTCQQRYKIIILKTLTTKKWERERGGEGS